MQLVELLKEKDVEHKLVIISDLGYQYPDNIDCVLESAIKFINSK